MPRDEITCALDAYEETASSEQLDAAIEAFAEEDPRGIETVAASVGASGRECFSQESLTALTADARPADIREGFILGFQESAGSTREEAACVFDELVASGLSVAQLTATTASPEITDALESAAATCLQ